MTLANHGAGNAVAHKHHQHLHQALQPVGCLVGAFLIAPLGQEYDEDKQQDGNDDGRRGLGDAEVDRRLAGEVAFGIDTHDLLLLDAAAHEPVALVVGMPVVEAARHEDVKMAVVDKDDRQRDGHGVLAPVAARIVVQMP